MQLLSANELALLYEAQKDCVLYLQQVENPDDQIWELVLKLPNPERVYGVQTFVGQRKIWKNLHTAVKFVSETCPNAEEVILRIKKIG